MTVSYSLSVSKATFGGFAKLLFRWKGSIFRSLWRECLMFCTLYVLINTSYRHALDQKQRETFDEVVKFAKYFMDVIPFYFIVGFYVTTVSGRWINQFIEVPWPDRTVHVIASYVHGSDDRSRMIRRTLARYAVLLQVLTFQMVSTAVRRRFPTTQHLVAAGIMTAEERSVFEKVEFAFGKWWLPSHWFTSLATRARKEGRIKDSILLNFIIEEMFILRTRCAATIGYDWISVPLAYTQVATIATYLYALVLLVGTQSIETPQGLVGFTADYYFPFVTVWRFFFSVGWLKVAEQLLNPYGEDDDDFELNWILDRSLAIAYNVADTHYMMHPKVKKDAFWDVSDIKLPQTEQSAKYMKNPDLGSAVGLEIEEADYLPMDELCEKDDETNDYRNQSSMKKRADRQNSSFMRRLLNSRFAQSFRRHSRMKPPVGRSQSCLQGVTNAAFTTREENEDDFLAGSAHTTPFGTRNKTNPVVKSNSVNLRGLVHKKSYHVDETGSGNTPINGPANETRNGTSEKMTIARNLQPTGEEELIEKDLEPRADFEDNLEDQDLDVLMPSIPEESSRVNSLASIDLITSTDVQKDENLELVTEARKKLLKYQKTVQDHKFEGSVDESDTSAKLQTKNDVYITIERQSNDEKGALQKDKHLEV